jgi:mono/diheme cytochrome c family protein
MSGFNSYAGWFVKAGLLALLGCALWAGTAITGAMGQPDPAPSILAGVYTEEQAIRGQALYYQHCLNCHGEEMGGVDKAPPLAGPQFSGVWNGEPLWALVIRLDTMPPDKPGSLSRAENVDLLAYMLWYNGLPMGDTALGTEQAVLEQMLLRL